MERSASFYHSKVGTGLNREHGWTQMNGLRRNIRKTRLVILCLINVIDITEYNMKRKIRGASESICYLL